MTKEELIEFLKSNLKIELNSSDGSCYDNARIELSIYLDNDIVASASCSLPRELPNRY